MNEKLQWPPPWGLEIKVEKACFRKRLYPTEEEAKKGLDWVSRKRGVDVRMYRCPTCHGYHLTSRVLPQKGEL
jgi:hypothetical protein